MSATVDGKFNGIAILQASIELAEDGENYYFTVELVNGMKVSCEPSSFHNVLNAFLSHMYDAQKLEGLITHVKS